MVVLQLDPSQCTMAVDAVKIQQALEKAGIRVNDVYDLVNTDKPYPEAVPVLIELLKEGIADDALKEGIIRALAVKEARGNGKTLIEEYHRLPKEKSLLRWTIGNTINTVIVNDDMEDVLAIVKDKENGMSRQMFVIALGKMRSELAEEVLIDLLHDDDVMAHAIDALGKMKSAKAKEKISRLLHHPTPLIRKEAQKALKKIG